MERANTCLYRSFIAVVGFIGIFSLILLALAALVHIFLSGEEQIAGIIDLIVLSIIILLLAVVGVFGAYRKKKWALILFTVGMILVSLWMIASEVITLSELNDDIRQELLDMRPLTNASESFQATVIEAQINYGCCGLDQGPVDWGHDIPRSCLCTDQSKPCVDAPYDSALSGSSIYEEGCLSYLVAEDVHISVGVIGAMIAFTVVGVFSIVLSILILCRMNQMTDTNTVVYTRNLKAGNY